MVIALVEQVRCGMFVAWLLRACCYRFALGIAALIVVMVDGIYPDRRIVRMSVEKKMGTKLKSQKQKECDREQTSQILPASSLPITENHDIQT
jgi:hypothetical protein